MIKLYQFPISHYCEKVRWALEFKGIEYETINLLPGLHTKTTKKIAPKSSVPLLVDGEQVVQNSSDILDYLEAQYPEPTLTPDLPEHEAQAQAWEEYADKEIGPAVRRLCYNTLLNHPDKVKPIFTAGRSPIVLSSPNVARRVSGDFVYSGKSPVFWKKGRW